MTAPGTWSSPPRGAIAVQATASPSPSSAAAFHRPAVAGFRDRSAAPGRLRSVYRSAHPTPAVAAGSPAATARALGAASSPATAAAALGRPRGAKGNPNENGPPDRLTGRFTSSDTLFQIT